jgi:adenine-specific DNA-methyltransferase
LTVFLIIEKVEAILNINLSRPFNKIETGRIIVKVINHLGDEVMKVFRMEWTFFTV